ncbi:MAG: macro domain-containing protein [Lachnospiraceae bacterium]|nr:macro domain-containing protein [Lachnospiraceae bacterium]
MALRIVRNDITKMNTEAIVNTAGRTPAVGDGCDIAVYTAAGYDELHALRMEIGNVAPGEVFMTPAFKLPAKYIIHAVSPLYIDGRSGEEEKLRSCYRKSLQLASKKGIRSIAFPLISTGAYGYPKEEGMRIAVDEINDFLLKSDMDITLVVFDSQSTELGSKLYPDLEEYINQHYVEKKREEEYGAPFLSDVGFREEVYEPRRRERRDRGHALGSAKNFAMSNMAMPAYEDSDESAATFAGAIDEYALGEAINERIKHAEDPFGVYLLYLIRSKGKTNAEVYNKALISKQSFAKLNKNPGKYHPDKITALQYCVGAELNIDETKDLLARAGYALSPSDKRDIIFSYFITHEFFDIIEIDIKLEEHGVPCIIK